MVESIRWRNIFHREFPTSSCRRVGYEFSRIFSLYARFRANRGFIHGEKMASLSCSVQPVTFSGTLAGRIGPAVYKSCIPQYTPVCSAFGLMSTAENETSTNGSFMPPPPRRRQSFLFLHAYPNISIRDAFLMPDPLMETTPAEFNARPYTARNPLTIDSSEIRGNSRKFPARNYVVG